MTRTIALLAVCSSAAAATLAPTLASAQQGDAAYCASLGQTYNRYVGEGSGKMRGQQRNASIDAAVTQCPTNSAAAIPVLEKALKDAKVDLPPRG